MDEAVKLIVRQAVVDMINATASPSNISKMINLHSQKVHFVPTQYRVLNGILQSLNIKFGNFIEKLIALIIDNDTQTQALPGSGKKLPLSMTAETDALIDNYITSRQLPDDPENSDIPFRQLIEKIIAIETSAFTSKQIIVKDVDALFRDRNGVNVYLEIKYNDDHDTGKFVDINRKFLKTYAGLVNYLGITSPEMLMPIIYYFNPSRRWGSIYIPSTNVLRGPQLFKSYFEIEYASIDAYLSEIGHDPVIIGLFDSLFNEIRNK